MEKVKCTNCEEFVTLEYERIKDFHSGDVLITVYVTFCPKCLEVLDNNIKLSR